MFLIILQKNSVFGHFAIICEIPPESFALHSIHNMLIINVLRVSCQTLYKLVWCQVYYLRFY